MRKQTNEVTAAMMNVLIPFPSSWGRLWVRGRSPGPFGLRLLAVLSLRARSLSLYRLDHLVKELAGGNSHQGDDEVPLEVFQFDHPLSTFSIYAIPYMIEKVSEVIELISIIRPSRHHP